MRVHVERCNCGVPDPDSGETILEIDKRGTVHPYNRDPRCREFTKLVIIDREKKVEAALLDAAAKLTRWHSCGGLKPLEPDTAYCVYELRKMSEDSREMAVYPEDELYDCPEHGRQNRPWCCEAHEYTGP